MTLATSPFSPALGTGDDAVDALLADVRATAALPLAQAHTLPAGVYTSQDFFDYEVEHVLKKDWLCVAHASQVPAPGDYLNLDLLGEPLSVPRGAVGGGVPGHSGVMRGR